jgi:hypothetical protein
MTSNKIRARVLTPICVNTSRIASLEYVNFTGPGQVYTQFIMSWSAKPIKLSEFNNAPSESGVYEIGFGVEEFTPKYLGYAFSSIKSSLRSEYSLNGNKHISEDNRDGLYVRWMITSNPSQVQPGPSHKWNQ